MKQFLAYFGLFMGFVATITTTQHLDDYSRTYQKCAQQWQTRIDIAEDKPYLSEQLIEYLETDSLFLGDKSCPKLLKSHAIYVRRALEKNL